MKRGAPVLAMLLCAVAMLVAVDPAPFVDDSATSGLTSVIVSGGAKKNYVLEVNGSGACWLDYDGDGWMDLYLVNGATLAHLQGRAPRTSTNRLYRNTHDGRFVDVTVKAGVPGRGWGFGCVAADYDNDGHTDLLVTNFGPNLLYRNVGDGTFADVTGKAGVGGGHIWHAGAAFGDYDNDGWLDLFVPGYLDFDAAKPELKTCEYRGITVHACGPLGYKGAPDALYHSNGDGTFTDVTSRAGVADSKLYFGFQAVFEDFDNDGRLDLFVGNDSNPNFLYQNKGDGTFVERGAEAGVAFSADGKEMSSMGIAVADYDADGLMDIFITTFADDNYILFHNDGQGFFTDVSYAAGVGEPTIPFLGWGTFFFDYDNDGWQDLFCVNGHVYPEVDTARREAYRQPVQLFRNGGEGKFSEDLSMRSLGTHAGRGAAMADVDNDGRMDVVVSRMDARPLFLANRSASGRGNNWLRVHLTGSKSNRGAIGARLRVTAGGRTQVAALRAGESYLSSNDPRLHFGLGSAKKAVVEVTWPSGARQTVTSAANRELQIRE